MVQQRGGEAIAFDESRRLDGRSSRSTVTGRGVEIEVEGTPPQGEDESLRVCEILRQHLNAECAGNWGAAVAPTPGCAWADGMLVDRDEPRKQQVVQVVRVVAEETPWVAMQASGRYDVTIPIADAVDQIRAAIEKKDQRDGAGVILALDATLLSGHALGEVVGEFRRRHEVWAGSLGYQSVWIVGPVAGLVRRLDS
jgi:hypothetical protein